MDQLEQMIERLNKLEATNIVRNMINRYMQICDDLSASTDLDELMNLFAEDAIWEGIGTRYQASFGRHEGRDKIAAMFRGYMQQDAHFVMNAHFLSSEQIYVEHDLATAHWLMLQTSTFRDQRAHLNAAKLSVEYQRQADGQWKISHFQTENILSRPVTHWDSDIRLPVPESHNN